MSLTEKYRWCGLDFQENIKFVRFFSRPVFIHRFSSSSSGTTLKPFRLYVCVCLHCARYTYKFKCHKLRSWEKKKTLLYCLEPNTKLSVCRVRSLFVLIGSFDILRIDRNANDKANGFDAYTKVYILCLFIRYYNERIVLQKRMYMAYWGLYFACDLNGMLWWMKIADSVSTSTRNRCKLVYYLLKQRNEMNWKYFECWNKLIFKRLEMAR